LWKNIGARTKRFFTHWCGRSVFRTPRAVPLGEAAWAAASEPLASTGSDGVEDASDGADADRDAADPGRDGADGTLASEVSSRPVVMRALALHK
jgi:hypothetical protein